MPSFDHANHKRLWNWLANNPGYMKADWLEWSFNGGNVDEVDYLCFACHASSNPQRGKESGCYWSCPLIWDGDDCCGRFYYLWRSLRSLVEFIYEERDYHKVRDCPEYADVVTVARKIRDLPVREEYKE